MTLETRTVGSQGPELNTKPLRQQAEIVLRKQEAGRNS
jgi:hypothetical protein